MKDKPKVKRNREDVDGSDASDEQSGRALLRQRKDLPLSHRYRPARISEIIGQEDAKSALLSMFGDGQQKRIPHAFLLAGPRGNGKTTIGRLISQRLNCESPNGVDPCGRCGSCLKYESDETPAHPCHKEVNASNERRIDDVRELIQQTRYSPVGGKYRVFLLDEPQGLVKEAQEALLTPMEHPPKHVVWILCTTDPGKLSEALRSRCAAGHIPIRQPKVEELVKRLRVIAKKEGYDLPKEALEKVAEAADCHSRDSLGILERLLGRIDAAKAGKASKEIDVGALALEVIAAAQAGSPFDVAWKITDAILTENLTEAIMASRCTLPPDVLLSALVTAWDQVVLAATNPKLSAGWWGYRSSKQSRDPKALRKFVNRDNLPAIVKANAAVIQGYERAKTYIIGQQGVLVNHTIAMMMMYCDEARDEGEEG